MLPALSVDLRNCSVQSPQSAVAGMRSSPTQRSGLSFGMQLNQSCAALDGLWKYPMIEATPERSSRASISTRFVSPPATDGLSSQIRITSGGVESDSAETTRSV